MRSEHREPINLGQDRMLSIDDLVTIISDIADKPIKRRYTWWMFESFIVFATPTQ